MGVRLVYDGRYFDESIYQYWTGEIADASSLTFQFEADPEVFPKSLAVQGWDRLAGRTFINNTIPGHESG